MDANGPEIGVCFHRPQTERGMKELGQCVVKAVEGGRVFLQLLELGYEKFPHNTTACFARHFHFIYALYFN